MRPLPVVGMAEGIEAPLLSPEVLLGGPGRLGLERLVHALVGAVLLGLSRVDQLASDAEADPPGGESGEPAQGVGGEGNAVVGPDTIGQAALLEESAEDALGIALAGGVECVATGQKAAVAIDDREREAVAAILHAEVALEVRGPEVVGVVGAGAGAARVPEARTSPLVRDQPVALEEIMGGAAGRELPVRVPPVEDGEQLLGAPGGVAAPELEESRDYGLGRLVGAGSRPVRTIEESGPLLGLVALDSLVARFPADVVPSAKLGVTRVAPLEDNELGSHVHR